MAISKIILNGTTQIDLTQDTVAASNLLATYTAHGADGETITGEAVAPSGIKSIYIGQNGTITENVTNYASASITVDVPSILFNDSSMWISNDTFTESSVTGSSYATVMHTNNPSGKRIVLSEPIECPADEFLVYGNTGYDIAIVGFDSSKQYLGYGDGYHDLLPWTNFTTNTAITVTTSADYLGIVLRKTSTSQTLLPTDIGDVGFKIKYDSSSSPTLQTKTNINPTTNSQTITPDTGYDGLSSVQINAMPSGSATTPATTITANPSISVNTTTGVITSTTSATQSVTPTVSAGYVSTGTAGTITVSGSNTSSLSTQAGTTINPTESEQTAVAANKYTLGAVKIGAISSTYVGTGIARKSSSDAVVDGPYVDFPAGYYAESHYGTIPSGTEGTPIATKGTVSNHSISITPSVINSEGFISGETKTGTAVTVTASELASGNKTISSNGTDIDVVGYSTVSVDVQPNLQSKTGINPTTSSQIISPDNGYYGLSSVQINAMPTMTLPTSASSSATSGYTSKATIGRSTSDQYINIPTGYNSAGAYYKINAVANGTEGTPTATKGTVSNHSISVTPSVTNTAGYISGGTRTGTAVTVTASELASGNKAIVQNGTGIDVVGYSTVSVAVPSDGDFTRIEIVPQQTFTTDSNRQAIITGTSAGIVDGAHYGVTYDGVLWVVTCETLWESNFCIGDVGWFFDGNSDVIYPFGVIWADEDGIMTYTVASATTGQHSIKIERLVFNSEGTALGTKTITSNGTYNASTDSLDGYSSVTVNVSSQGPTLQAKTNISPTTSSQTITADSGYDGLSSVQINAMPTMTLPSSASSTSSGTSKATISRSTSNQYINIPTGYNGTAQYYTISSTPNMTLPTAASSTSSGTSKATITPGTTVQYLNIPTGYNGTAQYYTISAVTYSTIRTGTTTPASSLGSNGDVYIKTS